MKTLLDNIIYFRIINFIIAFLLAFLIGFIAFTNGFQHAVALGGVSFGVVTTILDIFKDFLRSKQDVDEKLVILKRIARSQISLIREVAKKKNDSSTISCLSTLEYILIEVSNCCDAGVLNENFKDTLAIVSTTKTTLDTARVDSTIEKPYADIIGCISKIETYLNKL